MDKWWFYAGAAISHLQGLLNSLVCYISNDDVKGAMRKVMCCHHNAELVVKHFSSGIDLSSWTMSHNEDFEGVLHEDFHDADFFAALQLPKISEANDMEMASEQEEGGGELVKSDSNKS
jgi:hypothetical protein